MPHDSDAPRRSRVPILLAGLGFVSILGLALAGASGRVSTLHPIPAAGPAAAPEVAAAPTIAPVPPERFTAVTARLAANQTLAQALFKLDVDGAEVRAVVEALKGRFPINRA